MPIPFPFDFKNPNYYEVFEWRAERLDRIRKNPTIIPNLKTYYANNPAQFIIDWGVTYDPRNASKGLPSLVPFILFPLQEECLHWCMDLWLRGEHGLIEKSRDMGMTWLMMAWISTLGLFREGFVAGVGSRKEEYVDELGSPKCLLYKSRQFLNYVPAEFRGVWNEKKDAPFKKVKFPETQSIITGEAGDGIGRGDRTSLYIVDESAWLARPHLVDASLSQTTNSRFDLSSVRGRNNSFAQKRFGGVIAVFTAHWRDNPFKDQAWYDKVCKDLGDPVIVAQELDINYSASVEGVLIPSIWIDALVDAHIKLGVKPYGRRKGALDIADEGKDKNAYCEGEGILIDFMEEWTGKESDIFYTIERAYDLADRTNTTQVIYDADGLGAGARGDSRKINEERKMAKLPIKEFIPFRGSGGVLEPTKEVFLQTHLQEKDKFPGRLNEDYFANAKAQEWFRLRRRIYETYRAVTAGDSFDPDNIVSFSSALPHLNRLKNELSQPTISKGDKGKMVIDKKPDGALSPNLADSVMIYYAKLKPQRRSFYDV